MRRMLILAMCLTWIYIVVGCATASVIPLNKRKGKATATSKNKERAMDALMGKARKFCHKRGYQSYFLKRPKVKERKIGNSGQAARGQGALSAAFFTSRVDYEYYWTATVYCSRK